MSQKKTALKIAVPVVIVIIGLFIMKTLLSTRSAPNKLVTKDHGVLVEVFRAEKENAGIIIHGTGTVEAAQIISVIPQVSGRVVYVAPALHVGGFFKQGEVLFKIEDTDYRLALDRAVSARAKAEYEMATMESQASIARSEWDRINQNSDTPPNPLVLYEPQLKSAKAALLSASAQVQQAKIDLERTEIQAPFHARIGSEDIDPGQYVKSGSSVAVIAGTDKAEIAVPLPLDDLRWLNIPRHGERQNGADTAVNLTIGGELYTWHGHVVRSTGEVDPKSRMMQLIVEIEDPYGLKNKDSSLPALAAGTFVDVHIKGKMLKDVFVITRTAFRDKSTVWVMDEDNTLRIRKVVPRRVERDTVIIGSGLADGDMIVMTNISGAADGMKLRPMERPKE